MSRRGPKKKQGKREPNGRVSRRVEDQAVVALEQNRSLELAERETLSTGLAARHRVHGVALDTGIDQMAGSYVGRLRMQGKLTQEQYHAAVMFAQEAADYSRACLAPREPNAIDLNATKGGSGDYENATRTKLAYARYEASRKAVQAKQNELHLCSHLYGALQYLVLSDLALPHLVADLRIALTVLVKHYGLDGKNESTISRARRDKALAGQRKWA